MVKKQPHVTGLLDFGFATCDEVCRELGARLKAQRLSHLVSQEELAVKAGVSVSTVKSLESTGKSSLESLTRIVLALGLADQLEGLFKLQVKSIAQMEKAELAKRVRAPRKSHI